MILINIIFTVFLILFNFKFSKSFTEDKKLTLNILIMSITVILLLAISYLLEIRSELAYLAEPVRLSLGIVFLAIMARVITFIQENLFARSENLYDTEPNVGLKVTELINNVMIKYIAPTVLALIQIAKIWGIK